MKTSFLIQDLESHEQKTIFMYAIMNGFRYDFGSKLSLYKENQIPIGTVEYVEQLLGENIKPDYFPAFLKKYVSRYVWETNEPITPIGCYFIKPADRYKRFDGHIINKDWAAFDFPWVCSELVDFENEWRYYVANGEVLAAHWYKGTNEDLPAPKLDVSWPKDYCGAVDFGFLTDGTLELVEAHHPYACGWYGKDRDVYGKFIIEGWKYIKNL